MRKQFLGIGMFLFVAFWVNAADELVIQENAAVPLRILGTIYSDAQNAPTIESVKSWGSYLYLTVYHRNGDQKLEIWDVRDPAHPVFKQALDYGNLMANPTDHWRFPYVNVFDDEIIVRSNFMETLYHHDPTGALIEDGVNDFAASVAGIKNNEESLFMSSAGSFGTYFGRLFDPYEVLPEEEYGYQVLDFTNPRRPFVTSLIPSTTDIWSPITFTGHLTSLWDNAPSVLSVSGNQISLSGRKTLAGRHLDVFWEPRLEQIFHAGILHRTLRDQIEKVIQEQNIPQLLSVAMDQFFDGLQIEPQRTVEESLLASYAMNRPMLDVLNDYEIGLDVTVRVAVEKIVSHHLSLELEKSLSSRLFMPLLQGWMDGLFRIPIGSVEEIRSGIASILNTDLSEETVARYLLDNYIAPYADVPAWMFWSMDEMVDEVCDSPAGEALSAVIGAAHTVATAGGFLDLVLSMIPAAEQYYLPAGFPENCRDLLEYAFFEHGAKLNRGGLAFMELLKFYQYYNGNESYLNYENQFAQAIKEAQEKLSVALVETVEPFTATLSFAGDIQQRIDSFSQSMPCRDLLTQTISEGILLRLEAVGVHRDQTVHSALIQFRLYVDLFDAIGLAPDDLASVDDFVQVMRNDLDLAQTTIRVLWDDAKSQSARLEELCRRGLAETLREAWGGLDLDMTLDGALREFLAYQIDYRWTFGSAMDELLKSFITSALEEYPIFVDYIDVWKRADQGDVIARWQVTFNVAKAASALLDWTGSLSATCEMLELTLQETYRQATAAAVKIVLSEFADILYGEMFGGFTQWGSVTTDYRYSFNAEDLFTSLTPVRTEAFTWNKQLGLLAREEWDLITPRQVALMLFDPAHPEARTETLLNTGWGSVNYVHFSDGVLMICGTQYLNNFPTPTAQFLALGKDQADSYTVKDYRLSSAEGLLTANHGAHLVAYGPGGLFLLRNPSFDEPGVYEPKTTVPFWRQYENESLIHESVSGLGR